VLRSPIASLPHPADDALAEIRLAFQGEPFHGAVGRYAREKNDELAAKAQVSVPEALSALFTLELAGRVEQWSGGLFARASPVRH